MFNTEKTIQIQPVRSTEVCGKVYGEKNAKTSLLLCNVIIADHQNSFFFPLPFSITFMGFK